MTFGNIYDMSETIHQNSCQLNPSKIGVFGLQLKMPNFGMLTTLKFLQFEIYYISPAGPNQTQTERTGCNETFEFL